MTVDGIMSRDLVTVALDTTLMEMRSRLREAEFHHLLVMEDDDLLGVISDRDILKVLGPFLDAYNGTEPFDAETLAQPAREIMRTDPPTVGPDTEIEDAARLLLDHNISCLPVIEGPELVGIVTTKDLLQHYTDAEEWTPTIGEVRPV